MRYLNYLVLLFVLIPIKAIALIEVDITRGNLNPLPIAVSPLSTEETNRKPEYILPEKEGLFGEPIWIWKKI